MNKVNRGIFFTFFLVTSVVLAQSDSSTTNNDQPKVETQPSTESKEGAAPAAQPAAESTESEAVGAALQEEVLKRQEEVFVLNKYIDEGNKFIEAGAYSKAQERFDTVIRKTDPQGATSAIHDQARAGRAKIAEIQALEAVKKGDYALAEKLWQDAVNYSPKNKEYKSSLAKAKENNKSVTDQYSGNTAATDELKSKVEKINTLLMQGRKFYEVGRYNEASSIYEEVLKIDPYNTVALKAMDKIEKTKFEANTARRKAAKEEALANVDRQWAEKVIPNKKDDNSIKVSGATVSRAPDIYRKLQTIKIAELNFTDVEISQAISFLIDQSRKLDPDKKGINIVLKLHSTGAAKSKDAAPSIPNVSFSLRDVPVGDVLEIIHQTTGLQIKVEDSAVFILPSNDVGDVMLVRSFTVAPSFFEGGLTGDGKTPFSDVKGQLTNKGVPFPEGATASYFQGTSRLVVRGTPEMLNQIEQLVNLERGKELPQVEIETKFVQFSESQMKELRFRWQMNYGPNISTTTIFPNGAAYPQNSANNAVYSSTTGTKVGGETGAIRGFATDTISPQAGISADSIDRLLITGSPATAATPSTLTLGGLIDGEAIRLLISAMNHVSGSDVMSCPKLTLKQGNQGTLRTSREMVYPSTYAAPEVTSSGSSSSGSSTVTITPSNPEDFNFTKPKDLGVVMTVKVGGINQDSRLIDLEIPNVEVTDFDGFINYGGNITTGSGTSQFIDEDGNSILVQGIAFQPVFSVRKMSTSVQLRDGQGLVMGGLIRDDVQEINDKVPFFGDLPLVGRVFRGKSKQSIKKNLIIVTTAKLIGSDGKSLYPVDASFNEGITTAASQP